MNALIHRDYSILGSEIHIDIYDNRLVIYSPGGMFDGSLIQNRDLNEVPSKRRNPIIADVFTQFGYMEKRGSGLRKIRNETAKLPGYSTEKQPNFRSQYESFFTEIPNNNYKQEDSNVPQSVPQNVLQNVPHSSDKSLDLWIEEQIRINPKITTDELAKLSDKTSKTIKRHIAKMPHIKYIGRGNNGHWEVTQSIKSKRR